MFYAYNIEAMEPIYAEVFPGNSIDASSYAAFIRDNDIRRETIVYTKGFPPSQIRKVLEEHPDLHFLTPIKSFQPDAYEKKRSVFGVIEFESDQDIDPKAAYLCYDDRWNIMPIFLKKYQRIYGFYENVGIRLLQLVFNRYKSDECLDKTDVQGDFSLIGSEFINFISRCSPAVCCAKRGNSTCWKRYLMENCLTIFPVHSA